MRIEYNLMPQGKVLQEFNDCRARNSFIMGPLGSGKTVQCIFKNGAWNILGGNAYTVV